MPVVRVMADDHHPYRMNPGTMPEEIEDAVKQGFAKNITDIDCRQVEWDRFRGEQK